MRIALCLSGFVRNFKESYKYLLDNLIYDEQHEYDFFVHTYNKIGNTKSWQYDIELGDEISESEIIELYKPKKIVIEDTNNIKLIELSKNIILSKNISGGFSVDPLRSLAMFRKIYLCNELKKQYELEYNFKYDYVIRCRFDLRLNKKINFDENDINYLNVSYSPYLNIGDIEPNMINDSFAYSSSINMDKYSNIYINVNMLIDNGIVYHPETILKSNVEYYNIEIKKHNFISDINRPTPPRLYN